MSSVRDRIAKYKSCGSDAVPSSPGGSSSPGRVAGRSPRGSPRAGSPGRIGGFGTTKKMTSTPPAFGLSSAARTGAGAKKGAKKVHPKTVHPKARPMSSVPTSSPAFGAAKKKERPTGSLPKPGFSAAIGGHHSKGERPTSMPGATMPSPAIRETKSAGEMMRMTPKDAPPGPGSRRGRMRSAAPPRRGAHAPPPPPSGGGPPKFSSGRSRPKPAPLKTAGSLDLSITAPRHSVPPAVEVKPVTFVQSAGGSITPTPTSSKGLSKSFSRVSPSGGSTTTKKSRASSRLTKRMQSQSTTPTGRSSTSFFTPEVPKRRSAAVERKLAHSRDQSPRPRVGGMGSGRPKPIAKGYDPMADPQLGAGVEATLSGISSALVSASKKGPGPGGEILVKGLSKCSVDPLLRQMHEGTECLHVFVDTLRSFSHQQKEQSTKFLTMFNKSRKKYFALMESLPDFTFVVGLMHNLLETTVNAQHSFSRFIEDACLPIMDNLDKSCANEYKQILAAKKREDKLLRERTEELNKLRAQAAGVATKAQIAAQSADSGRGYHSGDSPSAAMSALRKMGQSTLKLKSRKDDSMDPESLKRKAADLSRQFQKAVADYNRQLEMYNSGYGAHRQRLVNLEHFRITSTTAVFKRLVEKQKQIQTDKVFIDLHSDILSKVEGMEPMKVLERYLSNVVAIEGEYSPMEKESAVLGVEFRDPFHSIAEAMEITIEDDPRAKTPFVVPLLCDKMRELGGFETEGIFRKSAAMKDMRSLKQALRSKDLAKVLSFDNCHLYAACLKDWCRNLQEPLIPEMYYDFCISMAKKGTLDRGQFEVFFSQLPAVNRDTIKYIVTFLRDLAQPRYAKKTKMTIENLAIVFGPTLLRNESLEPAMLMVNADAEKEFVVALLEIAAV